MKIENKWRKRMIWKEKQEETWSRNFSILLFFLCSSKGENDANPPLKADLGSLTQTIPCPSFRVYPLSSDWALEIIITDCSTPDALQVKQVVQNCSLPPTPPQMSSIPSFPHGESLLMKELVSLRRGRGAIKMKMRGEVRRTGRWEGKMSHL